MTDQQKVSATSIYGNPLVRTPFWERMAAEGISFDQAYATSSICTPSRATMMTGTDPLVHQVYCHQNHAPENLKQLPEFLAEAGYFCLATGHYEEGRSLTRGWHQRCSLDGTPALLEAWQAMYHGSSKEVGWSSGVQEADASEAHAAQLTDETLRRLDGLGQLDDPLFLHVAYIEPHPPYFAPRGFEDTVDPKAIPLPETAQPPDRPAWHAEVLGQFATAKATPEDIRRVIAAYYGLITYVDAELARLYAGLEARGFLDNTWVILCSDHGDYAGEKGFFTKTETPYECLLHVPLVIRPPTGQLEAWRGKHVAHLVELTDLFSTILSIAGCPEPPYDQGHDLCSWLERGAKEPLRDAVFSAVGAYHGHLGTTMPSGLPKAGRHPGIVLGARNDRYSYILDPDYGDEAYDLKADPCELRNLLAREKADLPTGVEDLYRRLKEWEQASVKLRQQLGVIPGDRNFDDAPRRELFK